MSDIPSTSFNDKTTSDSHFLQYDQENSRQLIQALENAMKVIQTQIDLQNLLLEADSKLEIANGQITQLKIEKSENEKKFKEELEKYITEKNQIDQLKHENKCISDLYEKQKEELNNVEQTNTSLNIKISELTSKLYEFSKIVYRYVPLPNKINAISEEKTCCEKKCINGDLSNGTCISNNGYVNVQGGWKVKYYSTEKKDNIIRLYAEQSFKKDAGYDSHYSLFYYEITMIKDAKINGCALIGFEDVVKIVMDNTSREHKGFQKIDWIDGDIFGCGLVFPPKTETKILPYVFFTKNGNKIFESIVCKGVAANLYPDVWLQSCSLEINFGNDLEKKPFYYNVSQHI